MNRPPPSNRFRRIVSSGRLLLVIVLLAGPAAGARLRAAAAAGGTSPTSRVLEVVGAVETARAPDHVWQTAVVGDILTPGDRLRTGPRSRATLQLSDHSLVRIDQQTTLAIQPPARPAAKSRFRLNLGALFFFDREKPADIEFDTPLATGAIRGTEFVLEVADAGATVRLSLLDGSVELTGEGASLAVQGGEEAVFRQGQPPQRTALLNAINRIQWALYYPAVLAPSDLEFTPADASRLAASLAAYRTGNLPAALHQSPDPAGLESVDARLFVAALGLAAGRVDACEAVLNREPADNAAALALRQLLAAVRLEEVPAARAPSTASEWLALSYVLQSRSRLPDALAAAERSVVLAPDFGFGHARLAELQFALGQDRRARTTLAVAARLVPMDPLVPALRGFADLERNRPDRALAAFGEAIALDPAFGLGWLGRGMAAMGRGDLREGERCLQAAAAMEPQRSLFRSYLGKAYSERGRFAAADQEFKLAERLDPADPTPWLYSALNGWQANRPNDAVRDLLESRALNDGRSVFRSRLLLDRDQAVRGAYLASVYDDAGLPELGRHTASAAVADDPSGYAAHLFLANSYQQAEDPNRYDLRQETARQSEWLTANLLAPPGGGNLSQFLPQQEHLRYFGTRPAGFTSATTLASQGDISQAASLFGTIDGFSYAVDGDYRLLQGDWPNQHLEETYLSAQIKQQVTDHDGFYAQAGGLSLEAGDAARHRDPAEVNTDLRVQERQAPFVYAGWHHEWSPGQNTLLLVARLDDDLQRRDPTLDALFVHQSNGVPVAITTAPLFSLDWQSQFTLYSAELQHLWQGESHALIVGARWQGGRADTQSELSRAITGPVADQSVTSDFDRVDAYAYAHWEPVAPLRLTAGLCYSHLGYPANLDYAPLANGQETRDLLGPKLGLMWSPGARTLVRAAWTRSLGGLYFDNSVRLEPTEVAGFTQAFRSVVPESVTGVVPGTRFETLGAGVDQTLGQATFLGVQLNWLRSDATREVGVLTNSSFLPIPDRPSTLEQTLDFDERMVSFYGRQLLGSGWSAGVRYTWTDADLESQWPAIPASVPGAEILPGDQSARFNQVALDLRLIHPSGFIAAWESGWYSQSYRFNGGPSGSDSLWQHNLYLGYRFPGRRLEVVLGLLNLTDNDYRFEPLTLHPWLPRSRTLTASLKLSF